MEANSWDAMRTCLIWLASFYHPNRAVSAMCMPLHFVHQLNALWMWRQINLHRWLRKRTILKSHNILANMIFCEKQCGPYISHKFRLTDTGIDSRNLGSYFVLASNWVMMLRAVSMSQFDPSPARRLDAAAPNVVKIVKKVSVFVTSSNHPPNCLFFLLVLKISWDVRAYSQVVWHFL